MSTIFAYLKGLGPVKKKSVYNCLCEQYLLNYNDVGLVYKHNVH